MQSVGGFNTSGHDLSCKAAYAQPNVRNIVLKLPGRLATECSVYVVTNRWEFFQQFVQPIPGEKLDLEQTCFAVLLIYRKYGFLGLG